MEEKYKWSIDGGDDAHIYNGAYNGPVFFRKLWVFFGAAAIFVLPWGTRLIFGRSKVIPGEWGVHSLFAFEALAGIAVFGILVELILRLKSSIISKKKWDSGRIFLALFCVFLIYNLIRSFFSFDQFISLQWASRAIIAGAFGIMFLFLKDFEADIWLKAFLISSIPVSVIAISQALSQNIDANTFLGIASHSAAVPGTSVVENSFGRWLRAYAGFPHPNILAAYSAIIWAFAFLFLHKESRAIKWRGVAVAAGILSASSLFFTFSRSGFLFFVLVFIFACVSAFFTRGRARGAGYGTNGARPLLWGTAVQVLILMFSFSAIIFARMDLNSRLEARSVSERTVLNDLGIRALKENYIFGVGGGLAAGAIARQIQNTGFEGINFESMSPPHNVYLAFLLEQGIIGAVIFFAALVFFVKYVLSLALSAQSAYGPIVLIAPLIFLVPVFFFDHFWVSLPHGIFLLVCFVFGWLRFVFANSFD